MATQSSSNDIKFTNQYQIDYEKVHGHVKWTTSEIIREKDDDRSPIVKINIITK